MLASVGSRSKRTGLDLGIENPITARATHSESWISGPGRCDVSGNILEDNNMRLEVFRYTTRSGRRRKKQVSETHERRVTVTVTVTVRAGATVKRYIEG